MSLTTLYTEKKTALAPPDPQKTYDQVIFEMEKNGVNNLVAMNMVDPTFTPPSTQETYLAQVFAENAN